MRTEHAIEGTIEALRASVWVLLRDFGNQSWNPGIQECHLIDDTVTGIGAIRRILVTDGSVIFERLEAMTPGRALTYSFAGTPPIPVLTSRTTIALTDSHSTAGPSTQISWSGAFDVLGDDDRRTVEHVNCDIVWPATLGALAAAVGAGHSPGTQVPPLGKATATP